MKNICRVSLILSVLVFALAHCSKSTSSSVTIIPDVKTYVEDSMPAGLAPTAIILNPHEAARAATAQSILLEFFQNTVPGISGTSGKGVMGAALVDLKTRYDEINTRFTKAPDCTTATATDWTITVGAPVSQTMTLKIQCKDLFNQSAGDASGAGSGIAWGESGDHFYIALLLIQSNGVDKFGYFADVQKTTKQVDLLYLESFSTSTSRTKVMRLLSDAPDSAATTKNYQLTYASTNESGAGTTSSSGALSCGTRLISDGTEILVDGTAGQTTTAGACNGSLSFTNTNCYSATSPSNTAAACTGLTTASFNSKINLITAAQAVSVNSTITSQLSFSGISAVDDLTP